MTFGEWLTKLSKSMKLNEASNNFMLFAQNYRGLLNNEHICHMRHPCINSLEFFLNEDPVSLLLNKFNCVVRIKLIVAQCHTPKRNV